MPLTSLATLILVPAGAPGVGCHVRKQPVVRSLPPFPAASSGGFQPGPGPGSSGSALGESHPPWCGKSPQRSITWLLDGPRTFFLLEISGRAFTERKGSSREILIPTKCSLFQLKAVNVGS